LRTSPLPVSEFPRRSCPPSPGPPWALRSRIEAVRPTGRSGRPCPEPCPVRNDASTPRYPQTAPSAGVEPTPADPHLRASWRAFSRDPELPCTEVADEIAPDPAVVEIDLWTDSAAYCCKSCRGCFAPCVRFPRRLRTPATSP